MRSVSIVIPTWNGRELLAQYLGSVVAAADEYRVRGRADVEVIIVDDASTDDAAEMAATELRRVGRFDEIGEE